ncbi:MAG: TIGR02221 family CRISPR-associated protein, partial [Pyrinomonadaceae bacterium]
MATVLVSFIGTGNKIGNENEETSKAGYEQVEHKFDNGSKVKTTIFGSALLKYLTDKDDTVDAWLIMGTPQSIWCDLIQMFDEPVSETLQDLEIKQQYNFLAEEAGKDVGNKGTLRSLINQEHLDKWNEILSKKLKSTKVICKEVGDATESDSQTKIFESILQTINEGDKVVFDVTHGLRNQPIITSFVIMYLRYLKNIKEVEFYYGAKDLDGKVVRLDFCTELLRATEAVAIYAQTGNSVQIGKNLGMSDSFERKLEKLVFSDEVNRTDPQIPKDL